MTGLVTVNALLSDHVEHHDVLAHRAADERLKLLRELRPRL